LSVLVKRYADVDGAVAREIFDFNSSRIPEERKAVNA